MDTVNFIDPDTGTEYYAFRHKGKVRLFSSGTEMSAKGAIALGTGLAKIGAHLAVEEKKNERRFSRAKTTGKRRRG